MEEEEDCLKFIKMVRQKAEIKFLQNLQKYGSKYMQYFYRIYIKRFYKGK